MSSLIVSPTPGIVPHSPLYANNDPSINQRIVAATPLGVKHRQQKAQLFKQINQQSTNQSPEQSTDQSTNNSQEDHNIIATFEYGSFPLPHHPTSSINQSITDLDASSLLQQIASSLSNLDAEQKYFGKENEVPDQTSNKLLHDLDDQSIDRMRLNENEGKDGPAQIYSKQLFSQHEPSMVIRQHHQASTAIDYQPDPLVKRVRSPDLVQHQKQEHARDALLNSLLIEQQEQMRDLESLQFSSAPQITLPQPATLPSTPPPLSQPAVDDSLMHRERPHVPKRFAVAESDLVQNDRSAHPTINQTADENAALFSSALELSVLARTVPDLPDLPDYSDITLPVLPDVPVVPEPLPEELPDFNRPKSRAGSVIGDRNTSINQSSNQSTPVILNQQPARVVVSQHHSSSHGLAAPPRPNRPGRNSQGPILPSAQKLNIHAPPPRNAIHSMPPISQAQQAQNAALQAALRTTLGDITDEQLEEVVSNK